MRTPAGDANSLGDTVAAAQDQIVTVEIESTDGPGHQRQVIAIIFFNTWQVLQKGGMNPHGFNLWGHLPGDM